MKMWHWKNIGLNGRTTLLMFYPLVITVLIFGYLVTVDRIENSEKITNQKNELLVRYYSSILELSMIAQDVVSLSSHADIILKEQSVINVLIVSKNNLHVFKENKSNLTSNKAIKYFTSNIKLSGISVGGIENDHDNNQLPARNSSIGFVRVGVLFSDVNIKQNEIIIIGLVSTLIGIILSAFVSFRISKIITKPVLYLNNAVNALTAGNLSIRVKEVSIGELGTLEQGINNMAASLHGAQLELVDKVKKATDSLNSTVFELEKRNEELDQSRHQAEILGNEKSQFLARMSHELRTPLNAVIGFSRLIGENINQQEKSDYAKTIIDSATQLTTIIDDILTFSKINSGSLQLINESFSPREVCENSIIMLADEAYKNNIELVLLINDDVPDFMAGDKIRFHQVLTNLINNAIKFTRRGDVLVDVSKKIVNKIEVLRIVVTDTGCGINSESINEIFKEFSQSGDVSTRRSGGVGLGLFISQQLAKMMGGEISVISEINKGSQFTFSIPLLQEKNITIDSETTNTKYCSILLNPHLQSRDALTKMLKRCDMGTISFATIKELSQWELTEANVNIDLLVVAIPNNLININDFIDDVKCYIESFNGAVLILHSGNNLQCFVSVKKDQPFLYLSKPLRQETLYQAVINLLSSGEIRDNKKIESNKILLNSIKNNVQVLLVEDNQFNQKLMNIMLESKSVTLKIVANEKDAINALQTDVFSLVFMDLHLPESDGEMIARLIRKSDSTYANIPIVLLTADVLYDTKNLIKEGVINYIMHKPLNENVLDDVLEKYCELSLAQIVAKSEPALQIVDASLKNEIMRLCEVIQNNLIGVEIAETNIKEIKTIVHQLVGIVGYYQLDSIKIFTVNMQQNIRDEDIHLFIQQFNKLKAILVLL